MLFQEIEDSVAVKSLNKFHKMLLILTDSENGEIQGAFVAVMFRQQ